MGYSEAQMAAARRNTEAAAAMRGDGRVGRTGRLGLQVDARAYFNAIEQNGGVDAEGNHVWRDGEFVTDMKRRHPEISPDGGVFTPFGMRNRLGPNTRFVLS